MPKLKWRDRVSIAAQALLYLAGGINHLWHSRFYVSLMPTHYIHPLALVQATGVAEMLGGIGLVVPFSRRLAAGGIVLMLLGYYDVHIYMARFPERFPEFPRWVIFVRLPLQLLLIAWAYRYTRPKQSLMGR